MNRARTLVLLALVWLAAAGAWAQEWRGAASLALEVKGKPRGNVEGALVILRYQRMEPPAGPRPVLTDGAGRAILADLAEGVWEVEVSHADFLSFVALVLLDSGRKPTVQASFLQASGSSLTPIRVKFMDGRGRAPSASVPLPPEAAARLAARRPPSRPQPSAETPTDEPRAATRRTPRPVMPEPELRPLPEAAKPTVAPAPAPPAAPAPPEPPAALPAQPAAQPTPAEPAPPDEPDETAALPEPTAPDEPAAEPASPAAEPPPRPSMPDAEPPAAPEEPAPSPDPEPPASSPGAAAPPEPAPTVPQRPEPPPPPAVPAPASPEPAPAPAPVTPAPAAVLAPPGPLGPTLRAYRDRTCIECRPGEWALSVETVAGPSSGPCDGSFAADGAQLASLLGGSIALELKEIAAPARQALASMEPGEASAHAAELLGDESSSCRIVALVIPKAGRFRGLRMEAADASGVGDCQADRPCPVGQALWLGQPRVSRQPSANVIWGLFVNEASDRARRARLTVYFAAPNRAWDPPR